jgi:hypothetical protein
VNGKTVVGNTAAIYDTGTTQIIGDSAGIAKLFKSISGAHLAPQHGPGVYTSALTSVATRPKHAVYLVSLSPLRL